MLFILNLVPLNNHTKFGETSGSLSYNFDYLLYLAKRDGTKGYEIFPDPPLQSYLKASLTKNTFEKILPSCFHETSIGYHDDSMIMIRGADPSLYTSYEGALILTKDHQTWLAYININDDLKKQIIVASPQSLNSIAMPTPLKEWVEELLPHMDYKSIVYKKVFP